VFLSLHLGKGCNPYRLWGWVDSFINVIHLDRLHQPYALPRKSTVQGKVHGLWENASRNKISSWNFHEAGGGESQETIDLYEERFTGALYRQGGGEGREKCFRTWVEWPQWGAMVGDSASVGDKEGTKQMHVPVHAGGFAVRLHPQL